jgi:ubiquinone/menaquinone biosynthesis C-methylase UbiE
LLETADIETSSDQYASRFSGKIGAWFLQVQRDAVLKLLAPYPAATLLDVGGGHGQLTEALVQQQYRVTVVGSAEECQTRVKPFVEAGQCSFDVVDFLKMPYADKAFQVVISFRLLPHVTQWEAFIAELARVAEKAVILDYPEVNSVNYLAPHLFKYKKQLEGNTRTYATFTRAQLLHTFKPHGFIYDGHYPEFFVPMVIHRKLKSPGFSAVMEGAARALGLTQAFGSPVILKLVRGVQR